MYRQNESKRLEVGGLDRFLVHVGSRLVRREAGLVYVVAADVYALAPHTGRGGWTWYTGSAGWMYRLLIETLLGVNLEGDRLRLTPRMPKSWNSYKIHYRYRQTVYHIAISRLDAETDDAQQLWLDEILLAEETLPLTDDRLEHEVELKVRNA